VITTETPPPLVYKIPEWIAALQIEESWVYKPLPVIFALL